MKNEKAVAAKQKYFIRVVSKHSRLFISIAIGFVTAYGCSLLGVQSWITRSIVGYDVGTLTYLGWAYTLMFQSTPQDIRKRALEQDDGKIVVLLLSIIAITFATGAIFAELGAVKHLEGATKYGNLLLSLITIVASWFFTATIFALHYAHDFYFQIQHGKDGGLVFLPTNEDPSYWDFMYFALTLSATAQTADITLSSKQMRRTVSVQSVLAFFFNTSLLALAINMASGLF